MLKFKKIKLSEYSIRSLKIILRWTIITVSFLLIFTIFVLLIQPNYTEEDLVYIEGGVRSIYRVNPLTNPDHQKKENLINSALCETSNIDQLQECVSLLKIDPNMHMLYIFTTSSIPVMIELDNGPACLTGLSLLKDAGLLDGNNHHVRIGYVERYDPITPYINYGLRELYVDGVEYTTLKSKQENIIHGLVALNISVFVLYAILVSPGIVLIVKDYIYQKRQFDKKIKKREMKAKQREKYSKNNQNQ